MTDPSASLVVKNLSYSYGKRRALDDVSFSLDAGRFCTLLGPNGAGKSTLFSLLARLAKPMNGQILMAGQDLQQNPLGALARMGIVFQQQALDLDLSVESNLRYFAALRGLSGKAALKKIHEELDRLEMRDRLKDKVRSLNGGHRRRMELARALLHDPDILLLDEPTVGLDMATRRSITDYVHKLALDNGLVVLWATHLVDEVAKDDHVLILHQGRIHADGSAHELMKEGEQAMSLADRFFQITECQNEAMDKQDEAMDKQI